MRTSRALALALGAALTGGGAGFAVGGRVGFSEGYTLASHTSEVVQGLYAEMLLTRASDEGTDGMLEVYVDSALASASVYGDAFEKRPFYAPSDAYEVDRAKALRVVATYRRDHPRDFENQEIEAMVRTAVARYTKAPATP